MKWVPVFLSFFMMTAAQAQSAAEPVCRAFAGSDRLLFHSCMILSEVLPAPLKSQMKTNDLIKMNDAYTRVFSLDLGENRSWVGEDFYGSHRVTKLGRHRGEDIPCREVRTLIRRTQKVVLNKSVTICLADSEWKTYPTSKVLFTELDEENDSLPVDEDETDEPVEEQETPDDQQPEPEEDEAEADSAIIPNEVLNKLGLSDIRRHGDERQFDRIDSVRKIRKHLKDNKLLLSGKQLFLIMECMFLPKNRVDTIMLLARYSRYNQLDVERILDLFVVEDYYQKAVVVLDKYL